MYQENVSCADAIFATLEIINRYLQEDCNVFMCLYDLQKVFDSVEIPVLLQRLFEVGVNSKTWCLLRIRIATAIASCELAGTPHPPTSFSKAFAKGPSSLPFYFSS